MSAESLNMQPLPAMVKRLEQCVTSSLDRWVTITPVGRAIGESVVY